MSDASKRPVNLAVGWELKRPSYMVTHCGWVSGQPYVKTGCTRHSTGRKPSVPMFMCLDIQVANERKKSQDHDLPRAWYETGTGGNIAVPQGRALHEERNKPKAEARTEREKTERIAVRQVGDILLPRYGKSQARVGEVKLSKVWRRKSPWRRLV